MPWGDCTGPWWMGPRANRAVYNNPYCRRAYGYGRGFGYGRGLGFGYAYEPRPVTPEEERGYLEAVVRDLEQELNSIKERIEKLRQQA